jgi:glycerophosphoryl diester phosphodiesterase
VSRPLSVAHRGYSARYPENSLTGVEAAIRAGADIVETDARRNAEGEIFCVHDPDLFRLTGKHRAVAEACTEELTALVLPNGERLMTLRGVFDFVAGRVPVLIDIKTSDEAMVHALLDVVDGAGQLGTTWFGFRKLAQFHFAKARAPGLTCVSLLEDYGEAEAWLDAGAAAIRIWEGEFEPTLEARLAPQTPIWITSGGRKTPSQTGDIDAPRLAALAGRNVAAILLNDPTALAGIEESAR